MELSNIIILLFAIILSIIIAHFLGTKRKIGFGWSIFFSLTFSPIIGCIVTFLSRKGHRDKSAKRINALSIIFWLVGGIGLLGFVASLGSSYSSPNLGVLAVALGFVGAGFYKYDPEFFTEIQ